MVISIIGVFVGIAALIFITWKGSHTMISSLIASVIVLLTSGLSIWAGLVTGVEGGGSFAAGMQSFVGSYFVMFLFGALLGELMSRAGYAMSIALHMSKWLGAKRAILSMVLITAILTFGGVTMFVVVFTVYPIALYLMREADIPKPLFIGALCLGGATFTMTSVPGSPSVQNVIASTNLGTSLFAAPVLGIILSVIMFVLGMLYLINQEKKARAKGLHFEAHPDDVLSPITDDTLAKLPNIVLSFIPIIIVFVVNLLGTVNGWNSNMVCCLALLVACIYTILTRWNHIDKKMEAINKSAVSSIGALVATGAVMGFGSVVKISTAWPAIVEWVLGLPLSPLVGSTVATGILSGVTASAGSGLTLFMSMLAQNYVEMGANPELLHRLACIASGTFDSLPHSGAIMTFLLVSRLNLKNSYKHIAVTSLIIPIIAVVIGLILATIGIV